MRIGERFYENFELRVDAPAEPVAGSFVIDLETAQVPLSDGVESARDEAMQAAQELLAAAAVMAQLAPIASDAAEVPKPAATPLELAVIALLEHAAGPPPDAAASAGGDELKGEQPSGELGGLGDLGELTTTTPGSSEPAKQAPPAAAAKPAVAAVAVREPAPLPENPNPSHVHLVLDEGAERVVVTVAVRGNEVNVGVRANDDQIAAALARNAATLDHAMRARGLDLARFSAERDPARDEREREREHAEARARDTHDEPFRLEEIL